MGNGLKKNRQEREEKELWEESVYGVDGKWGWFVVFNSFICNMIVDGMQYTFANYLAPIAKSLDISISEASLIGSLLSGFYNFSGPIAGALGNKFGFRMVIIAGSLVSSSGLMLSYFAPRVGYLYFFYGILGGLGFGMIYMASVITTSLYFEKYRALAASLSVCGTGVGTFVFSPFGTFLVTHYGWRYGLIIEGGTILICILCGLSFKPLAFVTVVPVTQEPSLISSGGSDISPRRGSMYYSSDAKKTLPNEAYPTFKEALYPGTQDDTRRPTVASVAPTESYSPLATRQRIYSVVNTLPNLSQKPLTRKRRMSRCCRICCFNFWHCRCKHEELTLGDRPMYRDDIFYGGSLTSLEAYSSREPVSYHLSVSRIPNAQELEEHAARKCCVCHHAFLRTCVTMTGFHLLKSNVFIFLCISSFIYTMSLYIPYVYIRKVAEEHHIEKTTAVWLVSALGISNTVGRLSSGIIKSFVGINAAVFALSCLFVSGLVAFVFLIKVDLPTLIIYSCVFGMFTAPFISLRPVIVVEFLGLEKLTNAFGLVLLSQGVASIIGPPLAGLLEERSGDGVYGIYLSGSLMILSALCLLGSVLFNRFKK